MDDALTREQQDAATYQEMFASLPAAMLAVDSAGVVTAYNPAAEDLFGDGLRRVGIRCCDLVGCGQGSFRRPLAYHCLTAAVLERDAPLHDLDFELDGRRVELSVGPLESGAGAVVIARVHDRAPRRGSSAAALRIKSLGALSLASAGDTLDGDWLHHRTGQLLRYLICARGHRVPVDELVDALWPGAGRAGLTSLRQAVHVLRDRLEPDRTKHRPSRFVAASKAGYELDMTGVFVDADQFEMEAHAALLTSERTGGDAAHPQLARAAELYTGEFMADEPYADWVLAERDRLRGLAARVLRTLGEVQLAAGRHAHAYTTLERMADLEPLDPEAQRHLIALMLRLGRHAEAARRYDAFRRRFQRAFDYEPGFKLAELVSLEGTAERSLSY